MEILEEVQGRPREMINGLEVGVYEERLWDLISHYEKRLSGDLITQEVSKQLFSIFTKVGWNEIRYKLQQEQKMCYKWELPSTRIAGFL